MLEIDPVTPDMVYYAVMYDFQEGEPKSSAWGVTEILEWHGYDVNSYAGFYLNVTRHALHYATLGLWRMDDEYNIYPFLHATSKVGLPCKRCGDYYLVKNGIDRYGQQMYRCKKCGKTMTNLLSMAGHRFPKLIYEFATDLLRDSLSLRYVAEYLNGEYGISPHPSVIYDWAQKEGIRLPKQPEEQARW